MGIFGIHQPEKYLFSEGKRKGNKEKGRGSKTRKKLVILVRIYLH